MKRSNNVATENGEPHIAGRFRAHCAAVAFPSLRRFLTRRTCLLATGKILPHPSARSALHSSPQNGGSKGKMIEGRSGGSWRGTRRELWAPPDSGSAH